MVTEIIIAMVLRVSLADFEMLSGVTSKMRAAYGQHFVDDGS